MQIKYGNPHDPSGKRPDYDPSQSAEQDRGSTEGSEAETPIAEPADAPYSLVQTVLIQDLSLHNAQSRITDLGSQLTETKAASSAAPSFLAFGSGELPGCVQTTKVPGDPGTVQPLLATITRPGYVPEGRTAAPPAPGADLIGAGFLQSAAKTAAGIAGGALYFEGIRSMVGHHDAVSIIGNQPVAPSVGGGRYECFCDRATLDELLADDVMEPVLRTAGFERGEFRDMLTEMASTWSRLNRCNSKGSSKGSP